MWWSQNGHKCRIVIMVINVTRVIKPQKYFGERSVWRVLNTWNTLPTRLAPAVLKQFSTTIYIPTLQPQLPTPNPPSFNLTITLSLPIPPKPNTHKHHPTTMPPKRTPVPARSRGPPSRQPEPGTIGGALKNTYDALTAQENRSVLKAVGFAGVSGCSHLFT